MAVPGDPHCQAMTGTTDHTVHIPVTNNSLLKYSLSHHSIVINLVPTLAAICS